MTKHLIRDLEHLKKQVLLLGSVVEGAILRATTALTDRRPELAREVLDGDDQIDRREVEIEEECLKMLALHQPVAADLRFIVTVLKVNNDLERMGDLAVNIAERAAFLASHPPIPVPQQMFQMIEDVRGMVHDCLDTLVNLDLRLAKKVLRADDVVDQINRQMFVELQGLMRQDPANIERAIHLLSASRHLERIADQATNIAEDVLFMVEGQIVRHRARRMLAKE
jgi:phosphate transport system protein